MCEEDSLKVDQTVHVYIYHTDGLYFRAAYDTRGVTGHINTDVSV